jgi:hypothetical protein
MPAFYLQILATNTFSTMALSGFAPCFIGWPTMVNNGQYLPTIGEIRFIMINIELSSPCVDSTFSLPGVLSAINLRRNFLASPGIEPRTLELTRRAVTTAPQGPCGNLEIYTSVRLAVPSILGVTFLKCK